MYPYVPPVFCMDDNQILDEDNKNTEPKKLYEGKMAALAYRLEEAEAKIKVAQNMLYTLSAFIGILSLLLSFAKGIGVAMDRYTFIFNVMLVTVFTVCGFFTKKHPIPSISTALGIYLLLQALDMIANGFTINGIAWKFVIIFILGIGLIYAFQAVKLRQQLEQADLEELLSNQRK